MFNNSGVIHCCLLAILVPLLVFAKTIYVSPGGDDGNAGTIGEPVKSLERARDLARAQKTSEAKEAAIICLRGGRHVLTETLILGMQDKGLTFKAYDGEKPVIGSGVAITGWSVAENPAGLPASAHGKVYVADIPDSLSRFHTLFDTTGLLPRARSKGFSYAKNGSRTTLYYPRGAIKNWSNLTDVEVLVRPTHVWTINLLPLSSVNASAGSATTMTSASYSMGSLPKWVKTPDPGEFWVENALEYLDEAGEWVANFTTRKLYLWARDGKMPSGILAPTLTELIRVEGGIDYDGPSDVPVSNISFFKLTFSHADRWAWRDEMLRYGWGLQHDWEMFDRPTAALRFRGAENCLVERCTFIHSGGTGVRVDLHGQNLVIDRNEFSDLGQGGVLLAGYGLGTKEVNRKNRVINNDFHHLGKVLGNSIAIMAWRSSENAIAHNRIAHMPYAGIAIGDRSGLPRDAPLGPDFFSEGLNAIRTAEIGDPVSAINWGKRSTWYAAEPWLSARGNVVEYNDVSSTVELLSDGNAIYISGAGPGNMIRYNYVHHNLSKCFSGGIRCDGFQNETTVYGNVLYRNGGMVGIADNGKNHVINNFIIDQQNNGGTGRSLLYFPQHPNGSLVRRNILYNTASDLASHASPAAVNLKTTLPDSNIYFSTRSSNWVNSHLSSMRKAGLEKASIVADPLFMDIANEDFRFKEGSPALALGIEQLDVKKTGLVAVTRSGTTHPPTVSGIGLRQVNGTFFVTSPSDKRGADFCSFRLVDLKGASVFSTKLDGSAAYTITPRVAAGFYIAHVMYSGHRMAKPVFIVTR